MVSNEFYSRYLGKFHMSEGVTYDISPEMTDKLHEIIDRRIEELKKKESKAANVENKTKENNMSNTIKNVLFLAPNYAYGLTVVNNLSKELDRKEIRYNASTNPKLLFVHTDKARIEITHVDPIKWTPDLFRNQDAIFGKAALVDKARHDFPHTRIAGPDTSLSKYVYNLHKDDCAEVVKPRETYIPEIKNAYFNDPVTVVIWEDGTKTVVKCQDGDVYSAETGLALCIAKKALGNMPNFNNVFRKWIPEEVAIDIPVEIPVDIRTGASELATRVMSSFKEAFHKTREETV